MKALSQVQCALTKGKIKARSFMPYLSPVFSIMRTHVTTEVPTMAVDDNGRLYVNEGFLGTLSPGEVAYCLLHEVLHIVLSHGRRLRALLPNATEQERLCWNIAADLCIQQMLARHLGVHEPLGIVKIDGEVPYAATPIRFLDVPGLRRNMTTEQYYSLLFPYIPKQPGKPKNGTLDPMDAGSNSSGKDGAYEKGSTVVEKAMLDNSLEQAEQAMRECEASRPGSVPGQLCDTLSMRLRPQPDPFEELKRIVSRSVASPLGQEEYTYRRLSRRQQPDTVRKRGVVRYSPECSIIVDTSGSMSGREQMALTAVAQGLRRVQQPRVVLFDAQIQDEKRMSTIDNFKWKGRGGTRMDRAIEYVDAKHRPDAIVIITDGETAWPAQPTRARLIIALVKQGYPTPAWARVVPCYKGVPTYGY